MKTLILYCSKSHGNTKKLVDAIVAAHPGEVDTIDAQTLEKNATVDFSDYLLIGVASGIYYSQFDKTVTGALSRSLRDGDYVFGLMTYGGKNQSYVQGVSNLCRMNSATYMGTYGCLGHSTYGPLKLGGGVLKGHPDETEVEGAVAFYDGLVEEYGQTIADERAKRDARDAYLAEHPQPTVVDDVKNTARNIAGKFRKKDDGAADGTAPDTGAGGAVSDEASPGGADAKAAAAPEGDAATGPVAGSGAAGTFAGTGLADDVTVGSEVAAGSEAADGTAPDAGAAEGPAEGQA